MQRLSRLKNIHQAFEIGMWLKGAFAVGELVSGIAAYFVTPHFLIQIINIITGHEFAEDPHDLIASYLRHAAEQSTGGSQHFTAYYLLGHGIVKLWLIAGLLKKRLWYYPAAMAVFGLFIAYQLYRFSFTHSLFLLLISAVDLAVVVLTWYEFRFLRQAELIQKIRPAVKVLALFHDSG